MDLKAACYLEGVSVKISENYRPPPKVSLPASLSQLTLSNIFADQYDFALELATLDKIQACRATLAEARAKRQDYVAQKLSKMAQVDLQPTSDPETPPLPSSDLPTPLLTPQTVTTTTPNSILQPTVAAPKATPSSSTSIKSALHSINLAEFEGHSSSPFEDLELKTLNDKAELALLLQPTLPHPPTSHPAPPPEVQNLPNIGPIANTTQQWSYGNANSVGEWWSNSVFQPTFGVASTQVASTSNVSLRQAKSVPDLSECAKDEHLHKTRVKSSEEYLRTSTPPPRLRSSQDDGVGTGSQIRPEVDKVFDGLDSKSRILVRQLADMGFPAARAARLVQNFKLDEKKVLDSLLFIQTMEEKGANALRVEKVLALMEEPTQEDVTQILAMTEQFLSLGFEEERVLKAIVETQVDRDRALDQLLS